MKVSIVGSLRDREVACSASDRQGSNFESCVWRTVSSQSSHHPQEVLLAQFSLYVHKGGLKPDSFHLYVNYLPLFRYKLIKQFMHSLTLILQITTIIVFYLFYRSTKSLLLGMKCLSKHQHLQIFVLKLKKYEEFSAT